MVNFGLADTLKGRSVGRSVVRLIVRTVVRSLGIHSVGLSVRPIPRSMEPFLLRSFIGSIGLPVRPSKIATLTIGKGASFSYACNSSSSDSSSSSSSSDVESRLSLLWVFSLRDCNLQRSIVIELKSAGIQNVSFYIAHNSSYV